MGTCSSGSRAESGASGGGLTEDGIAVSLQAHFDREDQRITDFMNSKTQETITMDNGQILEKYTIKEIKDIIRDTVNYSDGIVDNDDQFAILYNDGSVKIFGGGDDITKYKKTGIKGIIYENGSTSGYAGKGIKIENLNETEAYEKLKRQGRDLKYAYKNYGTDKVYDDWRIDFE